MRRLIDSTWRLLRNSSVGDLAGRKVDKSKSEIGCSLP